GFSCFSPPVGRNACWCVAPEIWIIQRQESNAKHKKVTHTKTRYMSRSTYLLPLDFMLRACLGQPDSFCSSDSSGRPQFVVILLFTQSFHCSRLHATRVSLLPPPFPHVRHELRSYQTPRSQ
ncbi:unnamed protein product, partial [Ectocarpus sp. 12 AP-2014]